jgi:uncharacterized protein
MASVYKPPGVNIESAGDRFVSIERIESGVPAILGLAQKGPRNEPVRVGNYEQFRRIFGDEDSHLCHAVRGFFDNVGKKAYIINVAPEGGLDPTPDDWIGTQGGGGPRGLALAERLDDVDLILAPDLCGQHKKSVGFPELKHVLAVQRAIVDHCERMADRFAILDTPQGLKIEEAIEWRRQFDTNYAAIYYPWIRTRVGEQVGAPIPPSGHIAGLYAATDRGEGVHRAPANLKLEGLVDTDRHLRKRERDHLFDHNLNCISPFPGRGVRTWGARTMSSDEAWKQVNVRRLFIAIRKSIDLYTQWVVFEPNEYSLWKKVTRTVEVFLRDYWQEGALLGASQPEAFYVKCDEETNPPESRDAGMLICEIGIAPVRPAEYIIVRLHQFTKERTDVDKEAPPPAEAAQAAG